MEVIVKKFRDLTLEELVDIYALRVAVFVVEQKCPYQEVDEYDKVACHIYLKDEEGIEAYARVLPAGCTFPTVSIGRVIARKRRCGLGTQVVRKAISVAVHCFNAEEITIEAQVYARGLYEKVGFVQTSQEFLEDGIPHIQMKWKRKDNA